MVSHQENTRSVSHFSLLRVGEGSPNPCGFGTLKVCVLYHHLSAWPCPPFLAPKPWDGSEVGNALTLLFTSNAKNASLVSLTDSYKIRAKLFTFSGELLFELQATLSFLKRCKPSWMLHTEWWGFSLTLLGKGPDRSSPLSKWNSHVFSGFKQSPSFSLCVWIQRDIVRHSVATGMLEKLKCQQYFPGATFPLHILFYVLYLTIYSAFSGTLPISCHCYRVRLMRITAL